MKALTLWQPWASLVSLGVKTVETRSWSTNYRGPLAVHAGTRQVHHGHFYLLARYARTARQISPDMEQKFRAFDVPFGAVIATANLVDCIPMVDSIPPQEEWVDPWSVMTVDPWPIHTSWRGYGSAHPVQEYSGQASYGDFAPGRWAWLLDNVTPLDSPVPARGKQRLWEWEDDQ